MFDRVAFCGSAISDVVGLRSDGVTVWPTGVAQCGAVWLCPVCSAKVKTRRAAQIQDVCDAHELAGGSFSMMTVTVRHDRLMSLEDSRGAVARSWRRVQRLKSWLDLRDRIVGQVAATEVTFGVNGWHPHLHVLLFVAPGVLQQEVDRLKGPFVEDWLRLVNEELGVRPSVERGVNFTHIGKDGGAAAGRYLSKIAKELTASDMKSGNDPFALLDGVAEGDAESIARWFEYGEAMSGARSISWSRGLRDLYGVDVEQTDLEVLEDDEPYGVLVGFVESGVWNGAWKRDEVHLLLVAVEDALDAGEIDPFGESPPALIGFRPG